MRVAALQKGSNGIAQARPLVPLLASICLIATGNSLLTTAVSIDLGAERAGTSALSLVLTAYPAGFFAGCLLAHPIVARLGHRATFALAGGATALSGVAYALTGLLPVWSALRLANGIAIAMIFVVVESWVNLYAGAGKRGFFFSLYMSMTSLAVLLGQLLVEAAGPHSLLLFPLSTAVVAAGLIVCFAAGAWPPLPAEDETAGEVTPVPARGRSLLRLAVAAPATLMAVFLAGMTNMNIYSLLPIYGQQVGLTAADSVALLSAFSIGGLVAQSPFGWLSDRVDRRVLLTAQGTLVATCCGLASVLGAHAPLVLLNVFVGYGMLALPIYPVGVGLANVHTANRDRVTTAGALLMLYAIGSILTPSVATALMAAVAPFGLFLLLGSAAAALAIVACVGRLRGPSRPSSVLCDCLPGGLER
jgi:MFS family permease